MGLQRNGFGLPGTRRRAALAGLMLAIFSVWTTPARAAETKTLFTVPPIRWNREMSRDRPAQIHGATELGNLTGGIVWGASPAEVNARLPIPLPGLDRATLPFANEDPNDIRYFWVRLDSVKDLREDLTGCIGTNSHVVFLFRPRGLFRVSWRLLPDAACPSILAAAEGLFARYLTIDQQAVLTTHYRPNKAEVVEITDPAASFLIPIRWENRGRR